jgi:hypothetical protein
LIAVRLTCILSGDPVFAALVDHGESTAALSLTPGFNDSRVYPGVTITVSDGVDSDSDIHHHHHGCRRSPGVGCLSGYLDYHGVYQQIGRLLDAVYIHKRIHCSLGYLTPAEFEAQWREEHTLVLDLELTAA